MTHQDQWIEVERLAKARKAACVADARWASRFGGDLETQLVHQLKSATVANVPLAPLLALIAAARAGSVGIDRQVDEPSHSRSESLSGEAGWRTVHEDALDAWIEALNNGKVSGVRDDLLTLRRVAPSSQGGEGNPAFYRVGEFIGRQPVLCEHGSTDPNNLCPYCEGERPYPGRIAPPAPAINQQAGGRDE